MGLAQILHTMVEAVLPQHCCVCAAPCPQWLCPTCRDALDELVNEPACTVCAAPVAYDNAPCPRCLGQEGRVIARAAALGRHAGALRELVHTLKYNRRWNLAPTLARELTRRESVAQLLASADYIVPIPLHWRRRLQRGYNHADLLAMELARQAKVPLCRALVRHRGTQQQASLKAISARARNVRGVFSATRHAALLTGKRVLLVDDVLTTQATLRAAAKAIRTAGPAQINAVVLAIADPSNREFRTS